VTNLAGQFGTTLDQRPVTIRCWWILAFAISFLVLLSTLFFLSEDAYAKSVGGAVGGGGSGHGHDGGGHKGGDGGGGHSSPVKEAADAVGGGAQRGGQALKDASGGVDRSVGKGADPVSEVAGPVASKKIDEPSKNTEPVADKSAEITRPLVKEASPIFESAKDVAEPAVRTAGQAVEPVGAAASPLVEPVAETTRLVVEPVKEVVAPVIEPVGEITGPLVSPLGETATTPLSALVDPAIGTAAVEPGLFEPLVGPSEPLVGPSLGPFAKAIEPVAVMPIDEAADIALLPSGELFGTVSSEGTVLHSELASTAQGGIEGPSEASASGLAGTEQEEASSAKAAEAPVVSKTLSSKFLAALQGAVFSLVEDILPIQIPKPLGAAGAAVGSLSGGSSSDSGIGLGILALMLVSLLGGKSLWSAREFLKPSTTLIPIIERPG
jgi:hypothetical protein